MRLFWHPPPLWFEKGAVLSGVGGFAGLGKGWQPRAGTGHPSTVLLLAGPRKVTFEQIKNIFSRVIVLVF